MARSKSPSSKTKGAGSNGEAIAVASNPVGAATEAETTRPEARKLEAKKSDSRRNVVPINLDDEIRRRAYELAEQRGFQGGSETEDWLAAEREVMQRYRQHSA